VTVIACLGHWYEQLLYAAPVLVVVGLVGVDKIRRRHDDDDSGPPAMPRDPATSNV
jgi:hypothetical protein